jgi:hypothetical protein
MVLYALMSIGAASRFQAQRLQNELPSVYITFKEFVKNGPRMACPSGCARLILHNNTRWPIYYATAYDPTVEGAAIVYIIELEDGSRDVRNQVDQVMRNNKLMPGKTLTFVVPKADFREKSKIYIDFSFSWEFIPAEKNIDDQAVHRAYFRANDLPTWP